MYNSTMQDEEVTFKDAYQFFIKNSEHIDLQRLVADFLRANWIKPDPDLSPSQFVTKQMRDNPDFAMHTIQKRAFASQNVGRTVELLRAWTPDAGGKVPAIKLVRESYGIGLKEAKDVVDALCGFIANGEKTPEQWCLNFDTHQRLAFDEIKEHMEKAE